MNATKRLRQAAMIALLATGSAMAGSYGDAAISIGFSTSYTRGHHASQSAFSVLAQSGCWVEIPGYGWAWRPNVALKTYDWHPYRHNGKWVDSCGSRIWVSKHSWGSIVFNSAGRWSCISGVWHWVPPVGWSGFSHVTRPCRPPTRHEHPRIHKPAYRAPIRPHHNPHPTPQRSVNAYHRKPHHPPRVETHDRHPATVSRKPPPHPEPERPVHHNGVRPGGRLDQVARKHGGK